MYYGLSGIFLSWGEGWNCSRLPSLFLRAPLRVLLRGGFFASVSPACFLHSPFRLCAVRTGVAALHSVQREKPGSLAQSPTQPASHVKSPARLRGLPLFSECAVPPPFFNEQTQAFFLKSHSPLFTISFNIDLLQLLGGPKTGKRGRNQQMGGGGRAEDAHASAAKRPCALLVKHCFLFSD